MLGVRVWRMRTGIPITISPADRRRLMGVVDDRNAPQKHVWCCRIVVLSADGLGTNEIMRLTDKSKTCVWRWQERFAEEGFEGLLRDKTRPSRIKPLTVAADSPSLWAISLPGMRVARSSITCSLRSREVGLRNRRGRDGRSTRPASPSSQ